MKKYVIRDKEAGNVIEYFDTFSEAKKTLISFEKKDKKEKIYKKDFYEIAEIN